MSAKQFLAQTHPFKVLPGAELDRLAARAQLKTYDKGETIYSEGDPADSVWVLIKGRIQIFKYTSQGRPLAIESIAPGELFGTLCRLGGDGRQYPCTAIASVNSDIIQLSDKEFLASYNRFPALVLGVCSLQPAPAGRTGIELFQPGAGGKAAGDAASQASGEAWGVLPFTKRELAEQVGTTVETTIRVMSRFQKKGWISSSRGKLQLKAIAPIQKLVDAVC